MQINKILLLLLVIFCNTVRKLNAQNEDSPKVILITIDGFRWQELFKGADKELISNNLYVQNLKQLKDIFGVILNLKGERN